MDMAWSIVNKMDVKSFDSIDAEGNTALILSIRGNKNYEKIAKLLSSKMSNTALCAINRFGQTAPTLALKNNNDGLAYAIINKMLSKPESKSCFGSFVSRLFKCSLTDSRNNTDESFLVEKIENSLNATDEDGNTALIWAMKNYGNDPGFFGYGEDVIKLLMPKMRNEALSAINKQGETALTLALQSRFCIKFAEELIPKMTNKALMATNQFGETALTFAICSHGFKVVNLLLDRITIEFCSTRDQFQSSYLHYYFLYNSKHFYLAKRLIARMTAKALSAKNDRNQTALDISTKDWQYDNLTEVISKAMTMYFVNHDIPKNDVHIEARKTAHNLVLEGADHVGIHSDIADIILDYTGDGFIKDEYQALKALNIFLASIGKEKVSHFYDAGRFIESYFNSVQS